jgi:ABC-type uncharacterized transport system substrate-binding protein
MRTRRNFLIAAAVAWPAIAWTGAVSAQSSQSPVLIGWLHAGSPAMQGHFLAALKNGLSDLGWKEGVHVAFEERWADGRSDRLPALAAELAAKNPAVIVASPSQTVAAAAKAAPKIPIILASGSDPVAAGFAASLARPGGMITGIHNFGTDVTEKLPEFLLAATPKIRRVGVLVDVTVPVPLRNLFMEAAQRSLARRSVEARFAEAGSPEEIERALARLSADGAQALVALSSPMFGSDRRRITKYALAHGWPLIGSYRDWAEDGALLSYGPDFTANYRRAAYYVDRILKGAKPGDLPIEQPTKIELVINLRTARALKLEIARDLLLRADKVIE